VIQDCASASSRWDRLRTPVLFVGEPGCGFEVCARHLHLANTPWVAPERNRVARSNPFEPLNEAREGTLFLGEIAHLEKAEQKGLAQILGKLEKFNVRLVCAATGRCRRSSRTAISTRTSTTRSRAHHPRAVDRGPRRGHSRHRRDTPHATRRCERSALKR
jgi:transcriptional regulator with AAA-type ATPase domain